MRSITKFRTTLGHKTNCAFFEEQNTEFDTVRKTGKHGSIQIIDKVNRCLARYSLRAITTNQPTNRAPNKPARPGPK